MKKVALFLSICVLFSFNLCSVAQETAKPAGMTSVTDEINSSFSNSKNTSWFIHRMKPSKKSKLNSEEKDNKIPRSDEKLIKKINEDTNSVNTFEDVKIIKTQDANKKESEQTESTKKVKESVTETEQAKKVKKVKESVTTTEPAEKVIKSEEKQEIKEEKLKQQREKEQQQYRELQELTRQYQQAVALYTDNNLDESLAVFSQIPDDKRPPEAWLLMGNILMDKDKKDEAVFMYGRAILTDSKYYKAYYNLGNVYLADDKFNMAVEQYKMAGKYNPNNPYIFYNLGCAYIKLGELKKAKTAFIRALEINNRIADFHYNMAYVYKKLKKEKQAKIYLDNYNKLTGQVD